jgi:rod shape determining protein RodA
MLNKRILKNVDWVFVGIMVTIFVLALVVLTSATGNVTNSAYYYLEKQIFAILIGMLLLVLILSFDYSYLAKYGSYFYVANLVMLLAVFFVGDASHGAQRWINLGVFPFQPSEFSKILIIISFAQFLTARKGKLRNFKELLPCFLYIGAPLVLILKQPDLGTSLVFLAIMLGMLYIAGANSTLLLGLVSGGFLLVILALWAHFYFGLPLFLEDYQLKRLVVFINPYMDGYGGRGAGYHVIQSMVAIGAGGFFGKGIGQGSQVQLNFLPEHHTDFIFAVVGEEMGFVGAVFVIALYGGLFYRGVRIAAEARDEFGSLLVTGVLSMFVFHVIVNIGMTIGVMPVTGIPLPLFSYGGTSMIANLIALGLILNVNTRRQRLLF